MAADQTVGGRCVLGALTAIPTPKAWPAEKRVMPVTLDRAAAGIAISYVVIGRRGSRLILPARLLLVLLEECSQMIVRRTWPGCRGRPPGAPAGGP